MKKEKADHVWQGPALFGVSSGDVYEDHYVGLTLEIPITIWRTEPDASDVVTLILDTDRGKATITASQFDLDYQTHDIHVRVRESSDGRLKYVELDVSAFTESVTWASLSVHSTNLTLNSIMDPNVSVGVTLAFHQ
jgi:hypothetical protein